MNGGKKSLRYRILWVSVRVVIILLLLLIIDNIPPIRNILPAWNATISITPASRLLNDPFAFYAVTGRPDASQYQVQARILSHTTGLLSSGVNATGGAKATGTLTFSQATAFVEIPAGTVFTNVQTDETVDVQLGQVVTVAAEAVNPGAQGNIPAYTFNGPYTLSTICLSGPCSSPSYSTLTVQNTSPFTGGLDEFVQQADIDSVTRTLLNALDSDVLNTFLEQIKPNEKPISVDAEANSSDRSNDIRSNLKCSFHITYSHKVNDVAPDVSATGVETCTLEVYDSQAATSWAITLLKRQATSHLGTNYLLTSKISTKVTRAVVVNNKKIALIVLEAQGMWVFQFSDVQKQNMVKLIPGRTQNDAQALLLKQNGVARITINTSGGLGDALPLFPDAITLVILAVPK